jgi:hypothetical protein
VLVWSKDVLVSIHAAASLSLWMPAQAKVLAWVPAQLVVHRWPLGSLTGPATWSTGMCRVVNIRTPTGQQLVA